MAFVKKMPPNKCETYCNQCMDSPLTLSFGFFHDSGGFRFHHALQEFGRIKQNRQLLFVELGESLSDPCNISRPHLERNLITGQTVLCSPAGGRNLSGETCGVGPVFPATNRHSRRSFGLRARHDWLGFRPPNTRPYW